MKILVAYGTTEGQTRKIARFTADRLADAGHAVELLDVADAEGLDLGRFGAAVLAGSIHGGRYQRALTEFARANAQALGARPTLFLSVSLSAAGAGAADWAGSRGDAGGLAQRARVRRRHKPRSRIGQRHSVARAFGLLPGWMGCLVSIVCNR